MLASRLTTEPVHLVDSREAKLDELMENKSKDKPTKQCGNMRPDSGIVQDFLLCLFESCS